MARPVVLECVSAIVRCYSVSPAKSANSSDSPLTLPKTIHISIQTIFSAFLAVALSIGSAFAQGGQGQGQVPFGTSTGSQYDTIDLANLSIQVHVPIRTKPGLLPFGYGLTIDDFVGIYPQPYGAGPSTTLGASGIFGAVVFSPDSFTALYCNGTSYTYFKLTGFVVKDGSGNFHPFSMTVYTACTDGKTQTGTTASSYATDGSGFRIAS
jgi:hypothetical protein